MNGMWLMIFWIALICSVHSRPQNVKFDDSTPDVEVQPQDILHVSTFNISMRDETSQRKIEENTKEILEKIEALNRKQGLVKKKKPTYFHFPFSYSKSQDNQKLNQHPQERTNHEFKFPSSPFENPIFQYLGNQNSLPDQLRTSSSSLPSGGITVVQTNPNAEVTEDDEEPGQYVKRKITHQQVLIVPSIQTSLNNQNNPTYQQYQQHMLNQQNLQMQGLPGYSLPNAVPPIFNPYPTDTSSVNRNKPSNQSNKKTNLENQTLNNIKNIVYNSQTVPNYANPYFQPGLPPYYPPVLNTPVNKNDKIQAPVLIYGPYVVPNLEAAQMTRQMQIQSPLYDYFPIYIKDPFMQFYTAVTTMIEYGPQAGTPQANGCKTKDDLELKLNTQSDNKDNTTNGTSTGNPFSNNEGEELKYDPEQAESLNQMLKNLTQDGHITVEFEDPNFQEEDESTGRGFNVRFPKNDLKVNGPREERLASAATSSKAPQYSIKENKVNLGPQMVRIGTKSNKKETSSTSRTVFIGNKAHVVDSPPNRDQAAYDDETEDDKGLGFGGNKYPEDVQVSHDGNKKLFSKDNTGSGIFIHKLKVRKGGVAIAGPGGIATAGDGGTAIVGPNGYAYTQPDSLAIAGTGTKVIAVEPSINLSDLLKGNRSRLVDSDGKRIGRVVAVGPVIYYNKG